MPSQLGIGVPVPKMLPITGTWTLPFAAYSSLLAFRVVLNRYATKKWIGERSQPGEDENELQINSRCHTNFIEYVPLSFILAAVAELNGANRKVLNYLLAGLFAARILHVELGMKWPEAIGEGRPVGFYYTQAFIVGVGGWAGWLVKGYWGF